MSLRVYQGEFLISPAPVHMGLNWCSHNCFYCFANLNNPNRRGEWQAASQYLKRKASGKQTKSLVDWYISSGYPIMASNDSDPFAKSNFDQFRSVHDVLAASGARFTFQTKGGAEALKFLCGVPTTMVYVSVSSDREDFISRAEPGAPSIQARLELISALKSHGHHVVVGINPMVSFWWDDFPAFVDKLSGLGVHHVWHGELHLQYKQAAVFGGTFKTNAQKDCFRDAQGYAFKKKKPDAAQLKQMVAMLNAGGINTFCGGVSELGNFWDAYFNLGFPFMPTLDGWFDHVGRQAEGKHNVAFTFDDFAGWCDVHIPFKASAFADYLTSFGRSIRNARERCSAETMREVLGFVWRVEDYPTRLRHDRISIVMHDGKPVKDKWGRKVMAISPKPRDEILIDESQCVYLKGGGNHGRI